MKLEELTAKVIGCAYRVHNRMGYGFLESVYERCLLLELHKAGISAAAQQPIVVLYDGEIVGNFVADLIVEGELIIALKSVRQLAPVHEMQLVNYLVATDKPLGLLLNFGEHRVDVKRKYRDPATPHEPES